MFSRILVPLDGSAFSEHALPYAVNIARRARAALHFLYVHPSEVIEAVAPDDTLVDQILAKHREYLKALTRKLTPPDSKAAEVPVTQEARIGHVVDQIHDAAVKARADLIVMTTHGRGPLVRFWLGSVADHLIRTLTVPLLLVRPGQGDADLGREVTFDRLLVPLDGQTLAEQMVVPAAELAKLFGSSLTLLRAIPTVSLLSDSMVLGEPGNRQVAEIQKKHESLRQDAQKYLDGLVARLQGQSLLAETRVIESDWPADAILDAGKFTDMTCLATHGRGGLSRMLLGSVADKVIRASDKPLLVYRPSHERPTQ